MHGVVTKVIFSRGFGFIRGEDGLSRFFHQRAVVDARAFDLMHEGQPVLFTPTEDGPSDNRLRAVEVRIDK